MDSRTGLSAGALVIDPSAVPPQPWQNGGGVTRELWSEPGRDGRFDWRVSLADIDRDGRFSVLPGVERTLLGVAGPPITLTVAGRPIRVRARQPVSFEGATPVSARRGAAPRGRATRVLNVMAASGRCSAAVRVTDVEGPFALAPEVRAVALLTGRISVDGTELPDLGVAVARRAPLAGTASGAVVAEIRVRYWN